jgi:ABC-type transport system involved in cytochrome c biogenesis permease subunit
MNKGAASQLTAVESMSPAARAGVGRANSELGVQTPVVIEPTTTGSILREILESLASLKLTVWLLGLMIVLVLAGTLAQVQQEIWQVVDGYFRTFITWIDFQLFFPPSFFPSRPQIRGGFYFPGGWTLGTLLTANLLAAHGMRFRPQVKGRRLAAGLALISAGALATWLVIVSGSNSSGLQAVPWISWSGLWNLFLFGLVGLCGGLLVLLRRLSAEWKFERRIVIVAAAFLAVFVVWLMSRGEAGRLADSSMRILWQLTKGALSGLVLLAGCAVLFRKRAGVILLHGGIGLLMFNELLVGLTAVEGRMQIAEGETVNYVQDIRRLELAVVDGSGAEFDDVVVVPQSVLLSGKVIRHPDLPFDIRVEAFLKNSTLRPAVPGAPSPATAGLGLQWVAEEVRPVSGTDAGGEVDQSAAYVTFLDKETADTLGTHLVSLAQSLQELPEKLVVKKKGYKVYLRPKRTYKPYQLELINARKDDYLGTDTPRNYSSDIRLVDPAQNIDQKVHIWMNNPLRYAGETFYQSSFFRDPDTGVKSTTLQVVTNTGWMIPYVACVIVAMGMLTHFSISLVRFLKRRAMESGRAFAAESVLASCNAVNIARVRTRWRAWALPLCVVLPLGFWVASMAWPPVEREDQLKLYEFGQLPVVSQGRAKPFDTLARNTLRILSERQTFIDQRGQQQPAIRWLLDVMARPELAAEHKVFRIEHPEILQMLRLEPRQGFRYAIAEFKDRAADVSKQARVARALGASSLNTYQKKILELDAKLELFDLIRGAFSPPPVRADAGHAAVDLQSAIQEQQLLAQRTPPLAIPPDDSSGAWTTYAEASLARKGRIGASSEKANPALLALDRIRDAYAADDVGRFNSEVEKYRSSFVANPPKDLDLKRIRFEAYFNHFEPFYHASVLYLFAFLLTAASWLGWSRSLNRAAFCLIVLTFLVHTVALVSRIYISGRPPVTNLYSSAVFIGWGSVLLGIVLECVYRMGIGNVISAVSGFATLLIAHYLASSGDTLAVLQAVLDTQFWLATHVVCITLGYATTYVAGLLGLLYVLRGVLTPTLSPATEKQLARMIYGTICFATFFSFVGTVLGGLWADDSWGRFWGWDPKENGALIIVVWNALVLHARWGKLVHERGLAVLAVAGNIAVSWSWFGVNELGIGLHSYGFTEGVLRALGLFVLSQLIVVAIGALPDRWWWSRRRHGVPAYDLN